MANQAFRKLEGIQQKIELLQKEQALAEQALTQDLLSVLKALGAFQWDFEILVGVLVQAFEKGLASESKEVLHTAGKTFLAKIGLPWGEPRQLWRRLQIKVNRLMSQQASLTRQEKRSLHAQRKARTRTLIQVGGLCKLAGLLERFGIQEGEDLQLNPEAQEKANALLGWLWSVLEGRECFNPEQLEGWKAQGRTSLRRHQAKHYH